MKPCKGMLEKRNERYAILFNPFGIREVYVRRARSEQELDEKIAHVKDRYKPSKIEIFKRIREL